MNLTLRVFAQGVRGIRIDYHHHKAQHDLQEQIKCLKAYSARVAHFKWAVQVYHPHPEFWSEVSRYGASLVDLAGLTMSRSFSSWLLWSPNYLPQSYSIILAP